MCARVNESESIVIEFWKFILDDVGGEAIVLTDRLKVDIGRLIESKKVSNIQ